MSGGAHQAGQPAEALQQPSSWAYQPPRTHTGHPNQRYYREQRLDAGSALSTVSLLRFSGNERAKLTLRVASEYGNSEVGVDLERQQLLTLSHALQDALHEIALEDAERALDADFDRISDELREADEHGARGSVYYAHPWIHYVPADQVQAKVAELEAAGRKRYMVLCDPLAAALQPVEA